MLKPHPSRRGRLDAFFETGDERSSSMQFILKQARSEEGSLRVRILRTGAGVNDSPVGCQSYLDRRASSEEKMSPSRSGRQPGVPHSLSAFKSASCTRSIFSGSLS